MKSSKRGRHQDRNWAKMAMKASESQFGAVEHQRSPPHLAVGWWDLVSLFVNAVDCEVFKYISVRHPDGYGWGFLLLRFIIMSV